ncbi:MAG: tungstate ABC transporter substrate-binding protein WtpA [Bacteroidota bacterium]
MFNHTYPLKMKNMMFVPRKKISIILLLFSFLILISCKRVKTDDLSGDLIVFHAGSLSMPLKEITAEFKKEYPNTNVLLESAGSVECARKITELNKPCDILLSADYTVIDKLLIPKYTDWNIKFASNEMVIVYTEKSKRSSEIDSTNWIDILLDKNVEIGRSDPNSDPCGYRTVLVTKLAENYYKTANLSNLLMSKDKENMRPKETDLLALLETNSVDYIFLYRSVAVQHHLKYVTLPDEINLKSTKFANTYQKVSTQINGKSPNEKITQIGEPMVYGITILNNAPHQKLALAFVKFLLTKEKGMAILNKLGQPSVIPSSNINYDKIPDELRGFVSK